MLSSFASKARENGDAIGRGATADGAVVLGGA